MLCFAYLITSHKVLPSDIFVSPCVISIGRTDSCLDPREVTAYVDVLVKIVMSGIISSSPGCPLVPLPPELRRLIYTLVLRSPRPLRRPGRCLHPWCHPSTVNIDSRSVVATPSLLLVSRDFTKECLPIFYETNTFCFQLCCSSPTHSCPTGPQNGILYSHHLPLIRHFSFSFDEKAFCEWTYCRDDATHMCDALRSVTIPHRKPGQSLKGLTLSFPYCTSGDRTGSGERIVASAIKELMAEGELALTLKMVVDAKKGRRWCWNKSAIEHLVKVIGTPRGALWEQGHRWTPSYWETWAALVPAHEVTTRFKEQNPSSTTASPTIKTIED